MGATTPITFNYANLSQTATDLQNALHALGYDPLTTVSVESGSAPYVLRVTWGGADAGTDPLLVYNPVIDPGTNLPDLAATVTISSAVPFIADMNDDGFADTPIQGVQALGGQFQVNTLTTNPQGTPTIGMDSAGNFTIAWATEGQHLSFFNTIEAQIYDHNGNPVGTEFSVSSDQTTANYQPFAAMSADGKAIAITWTVCNDPNQFLGGNVISSTVAAVYNAQGTALISQFATGGAGGATVAFDADDNFVVGYEYTTTQQQPWRYHRTKTSSPRNTSYTTAPARSAAPSFGPSSGSTARVSVQVHPRTSGLATRRVPRWRWTPTAT